MINNFNSKNKTLNKIDIKNRVRKSMVVLFNDTNSAGDFDVFVNPKGLYIVPKVGGSVAITSDFYFKILDVLEVALWPDVQMQHPLVMQLKDVGGGDWQRSRAFFYPWLIGASERLKVSSNELISLAGVNHSFRMMSNIDVSLEQHWILSGSTGSGKSYLFRQLLDVASSIAERVVLIDGKLSDGARWARNKNVDLVIPTLTSDSNGATVGSQMLDKAIDKLAEIESIMYQRQSRLYSETSDISVDYRSLGLKPIYLFIDELGALTVGADKKQKQMFFDYLTRLALLARESGIVMILSLQQARNEELPTVVRAQMGVKILLGPSDKDNSQFLFPSLDKVPFLPEQGKGVGIMSVSGDDRLSGIVPVATPTIIDGGNKSW